MSVASRLAARAAAVPESPGAAGAGSPAWHTRCRRSCSSSCSSSWPLLLVGQMSASDWKLLTGDKGINFPTNYGALDSNPLFWPAVEFTIRYTVIVTVLLIGLGLGLALLVQETSRWVGMLRTVFLLPLAVGLAAASLLFWGFYSDQIGPRQPAPRRALGLIDEPILFFATHTNAFLSTVFMIIWKFVGLYMLILLVGLQAISTRALRGRVDRRRRPLADLPAHHAAAAAPVTGPGADPVRDRIAAGVRPLLPADQGWSGQLDGDHRPADLPAGVRAPEPGHRRRAVAGAACGPAGPQPHLVPPASARDRQWRERA